MAKTNGVVTKQDELLAKSGTKIRARKEVARAIDAIENGYTPQRIIIPRPDMRSFKLNIVGLSPLMQNRWSEKQKRKLAEAESGAPKTKKREPRDPVGDFEAASHRLPDGSYAFPGAAFRKAAISAVRLVDGLTMTETKQLFFVIEDLVKLKCGEPVMDDRIAKMSNGQPSPRYRPVFWPWATTITVRYCATAVSIEQIINLMALAGECVGIGELRPERGAGSYGRFSVEG